ncbi:MAG: hypothetical protein HY020_27085 [Burkholderiales bacterium]|nr:hypothetical protein [Burkholderiales bacterium]
MNTFSHSGPEFSKNLNVFNVLQPQNLPVIRSFLPDFGQRVPAHARGAAQ